MHAAFPCYVYRPLLPLADFLFLDNFNKYIYVIFLYLNFHKSLMGILLGQKNCLVNFAFPMENVCSPYIFTAQDLMGSTNGRNCNINILISLF